MADFDMQSRRVMAEWDDLGNLNLAIGKVDPFMLASLATYIEELARISMRQQITGQAMKATAGKILTPQEAAALQAQLGKQ